MGGYVEYTGALRNCACLGASAPCANACSKEFCTSGMFATPGDACEPCVTTAASGTCSSAITMCKSSITCNAYYTCEQGCPPPPG